MNENIVVRVHKITFGELFEQALQSQETSAKDSYLWELLWRTRGTDPWKRVVERDDVIGLVFGRLKKQRYSPDIKENDAALLQYTIMVPKTLKIALQAPISCRIDTLVVQIFASLVGRKNIVKSRFEEKADSAFCDFWVYPERDGLFVGRKACSTFELGSFEEYFNDKLSTLIRLMGLEEFPSLEKQLYAVVVPLFPQDSEVFKEED